MSRHIHVTFGRRVTPAAIPVWLRRKLDASQQRDLAMAHLVNLDAIAAGDAAEEILWQTVGGALTWSRIAQLLMRRDAERFTPLAEAMAGQLRVCHALVDRWRTSGLLAFQGGEYDEMREALPWMEALAAYIDQPTAERAADWSEARLDELRSAA